jgi:tetratricopeptide (TPR) repeat protein
MAHAARPARRSSPFAEVEEGYRAAEALESAGDQGRYVEALKGFLATAEAKTSSLAEHGPEVAGLLDEAAMAFYRASRPELARRAVDLGLRLGPGTSALLHHKALILLALNEDLPSVVELVDQALEANPHDKSLWATRADALRLLGRADEAAQSYLKAQELDPASTQYVDRALKIAPHDPRALRLKIDLATARGGDLQALAACDQLLKSNPDDPELWRARAEVLASLARFEESLEAVERARSAKPDDLPLELLHVRVLFQLKRPDEALPIAHALVARKEPPTGAALEQIATIAGPENAELAIAARERLREVEPRNVQNLLHLRTLAARLDRVDTALAACRAVLAASPDNLEAMRGIAELQAAAGHTAEAIEAYRAIAKSHPHAVGELRKALELAQEIHRTEAVREFADAVLAVDPADSAARVALARGLASSGSVAQALKEYDALLAAHPGELPYLLEKRDLLARSGDRTGLGPLLDELFRLDPTRTDVAVDRGNFYLASAYDLPEGSHDRDAAARTALVSYERASTDPAALGVSLLGIARASLLIDDHDRALTTYTQFLAQDGNQGREDVRKELAHALKEAGRYAEAAEEYERAIAGGLEDSELLWGAVEVYVHLNQDAPALRLLNLLVKREPTNPVYLRKKGQLLMKAGRRDDALMVLQQAVQGAQSDPHAHFEVAEALRTQGAYPDAISYYRRGLALDPKSRPGRLALAETLLLAGDYPEVVSIVDPLLKEDPNDLAAWRARCDAWRALGRASEVLYSLQAILLLEPDSGPALLEMYRLRRDAGDSKGAFDAITRLLRSNAAEAQDPTLHLERGDLAAALGLTDEASSAYERAAALDPAYQVEISVRRARLRLAAGRPDLALEVMDEGLKSIPPGTVPSVSALLLRAEILGALERPAEARSAFEEVLKRDPKSPLARAGVAQSMLAEGRHADAAVSLREAIQQLPPEEKLFLLLAEAESGLGHLDKATDAVKQGIEALPQNRTLWVRLGELGIARQEWAEAANAYAHALAIAPTATDVLLRAGFVAERLGHPNEAVAFYDRATEAEPANKQAWTSRGLALLATGRPADALTSFERSLALDSDFAPAKDGKKLAVQKTRDAEVQRYGREALLLEAKVHRAVAKNDLFVTLHVPYEFLDPVLAAVSRTPKLDLERLGANEVRDLENASYHLITAALEHRPAGIEHRGLGLADVAVLSPPTASLDQIQRLFGYLRAVLEADLRPENLSLTPDVEELARRALGLPPEQRTLFQLVRNLRVGVFKARLIKVVEEAGSAVHAPLPSLDLGAYSPEFRSAEGGGETAAEGAVYFAAETTPVVGAASAASEPSSEGSAASPHVGTTRTVAPGSATPARCVGCGGIASLVHTCGAPLCRNCVTQFPNCPKCGQPAGTESTRKLSAADTEAGHPAPRTAHPLGAIRGVFRRPKSDARAPEPTAPPASPPKSHAEGETKSRAPPPHRTPSRAGAASGPSKKAPEPATPDESESSDDPPAHPPSGAPPPPKPRREKPDDEPRL